MNLDSDHDIQKLTARDILDAARRYGATVTHVLLNDAADRLPPGDIGTDMVLRAAFANPARPAVHNGTAVADAVLGFTARRTTPSVEIFADIHNRSVASDELVEEFLENGLGGR